MGGELSFTLSTPKLKLKLKLEELRRVKVHEEIIPELAGRLAEEIRADGLLKHPVIVDSQTLVVLDGMHRVAALEELGFKFLPVCLVDYRNPEVRVGCWYRTFRGRVEKLLAEFESLELGVEELKLEQAQAALEAREISAALLVRGRCFSLGRGGREVKELYDEVGRVERALRSRGFGVGFATERDALERARRGKVAGVLLTPRARKEEVIQAALSGRVFAHKTTRHVIPARPMGTNVPLEWLTGDAERANLELTASLRRRRVKRLPPGEVFEGRRYEEELWVFEG